MAAVQADCSRCTPRPVPDSSSGFLTVYDTELDRTTRFDGVRLRTGRVSGSNISATVCSRAIAFLTWPPIVFLFQANPDKSIEIWLKGCAIFNAALPPVAIGCHLIIAEQLS
jgi:hypothetical protein